MAMSDVPLKLTPAIRRGVVRLAADVTLSEAEIVILLAALSYAMETFAPATMSRREPVLMFS